MMLDHYVFGDVERISPEAPVPVLRAQSQSFGLGGAGNVAQNLRALGATAIPVGVCGSDENGEKLKRLFRDQGISTEGIIVDEKEPTTMKTRVVARKHQLLRIDHEGSHTFSSQTYSALTWFVEEHIGEWDVLIFSDYAKGVLTPTILQKCLSVARESGRPTLVDPKHHDYNVYRGCTVITPNAKEASQASHISLDANASAENAARKISEITQCRWVVITRGEHGMSVFDGNEARHLPALAQDVFDVTGAGDTVISILGAACALGLSPWDAAALANAAASVVVGHFGAVPCSRAELEQKFP
jgi:D-beta-D-heptose 7-phosphate kinase/D-beta-D-heptose 1-phosphate adenosyltransferase